MIWELFLIIYSIFTLLNIWITYCTILINPNKYPKYNKKVSIIIATYNEQNHILDRTIKNAVISGDEVIVVDDGSSDWVYIPKLPYKFKFFHYDGNKGKRYALDIGIKKAKHPIIVTVDSDTIINRNSVLELIKPFNDLNVGAVTGNVKVSNRGFNLLTKMISARYWSAFELERKRQSYFGVVTCCSGVLTAYRKELLIDILPKFMNQKFLGQLQNYGEDRALTTFILKKGYKVVYSSEAIAYTEVPKNLITFMIQQLRWKKSFIKYSMIALKFGFKRSWYYFYEIIYGLIIPFFGFLVRVMMLVLVVLDFRLSLWYLGTILFMSFLRNYIMLVNDKKYFYYTFLYSILHELIIFWLFFIALFRLRNNKWGTR